MRVFFLFIIISIVCIYVCVVTVEEGDTVYMHHNTCVDIRRNKFRSYLYPFPSLCRFHGSNLGHQLCPACTFTQWAISQGQLFSLFLWQKRGKNWQKLLMEGRILFTSLWKVTVHRDEKGMAKRVAAALVEVSEPVGQAVSIVWARIGVNLSPVTQSKGWRLPVSGWIFRPQASLSRNTLTGTPRSLSPRGL